jgi:hypothetical protein
MNAITGKSELTTGEDRQLSSHSPSAGRSTRKSLIEKPSGRQPRAQVDRYLCAPWSAQADASLEITAVIRKGEATTRRTRQAERESAVVINLQPGGVKIDG